MDRPFVSEKADSNHYFAQLNHTDQSFIHFLFDRMFDIQSITFFSAIVLGLVAGSSSCLAVSGGLLLSMVGKTHERLGQMPKKTRHQLTWYFVVGRVVSYAVFGALIGWLGSAFTFSPVVTGIITLVAAFYMILAACEMFGISPKWLKCLVPRPPKWLSNKILDADGNPHPLAPFMLGSATFFLPCGFTQFLQIYALTTANAFTGMSVLTGFALGTAPMLIALGYASGALKGKIGTWVLKAAALFILFLAMQNIQNGLTLLGHPLSFDSSNTTSSGGYKVVPSNTAADSTPSPFVKINENGEQLVQLSLINRAPYYSPSNQFSVQAGKPVRLEILGEAGGCRSVLQIPGQGVQILLNNEVNVATFTPTKKGVYVFSCSMGMYPGKMIVE